MDRQKLTEKKKTNFLLTQKGHFVREVGFDKKCHCNSGKKYKNCCRTSDVSGCFDSQAHIFYCDVTEFLEKFKNQLDSDNKKIEENKTKEDNNRNNYGNSNGNGNGNVNSLTNQFEKIYI